MTNSSSLRRPACPALPAPLPVLHLPEKQQGVALLEALLSILIFSIGILSLIGMQAASTRYATDAQFRSMATFLANQRLGEIWVDKANITTYAETGATLPNLPAGKRIVTVEGNVQDGYLVKVTINWKLPGETTTHAVLMQTNIHDRCETTNCD